MTTEQQYRIKITPIPRALFFRFHYQLQGRTADASDWQTWDLVADGYAFTAERAERKALKKWDREKREQDKKLSKTYTVDLG